MSDTDAETTFGDWTMMGQNGEPNRCFQAQVWDENGDSLAILEPTADPNVASKRARLIAAAGTAAHELPDEYDAVEAQNSYMDIIKAAESLIDDTYHRGDDGQPMRTPPSKTLIDELEDALQKAQKDHD